MGIYVNEKMGDIYDLNLGAVYSLNKMISFKETKKDKEAIFVIIDGDDAWIYKLVANEME